jgi:autotransporter-associated beta strand protein
VASNTLGVTYYGKYTDTNTPPLDGSAPWQLPADGAAVGLNFWTQFEGGSNPDAAGMAALLTSGTAGFSASPTNGLAPLTVIFTNTSVGPITNQFWQFGDGGTSSLVNPSYTYTNGGRFSVSLTVLSPYGMNTLIWSNLITVTPVVSATWTNANGSGNWSDPSNWDSPAGPPDYSSSVIFSTAGMTSVVDNVSRIVDNVTFSGSGNFYVAASGGANLTINNGITVAANAIYTISAPVVLGGANTWLVTGSGILQMTGPITGANPITKTGSGTLLLSGTNTYSGATIISNGTLQVTGAGLIANTPSISIVSNATLDVSGCAGGSMTLFNGQTLQGNGTVQGKLVLASGSTLSPGGNSVGTLTFLNDLVVSNGAVLRYDLGTNSDLTVVSGNLTLGGTLNIYAAGGFTVTAGTYTLITYGGTLTFNGMTIGNAPSGYACVIDTNTAGQVRVDVTPSSTITVSAGDLEDRFGNLMPTSGVAVLVVDMGTNGFVDPLPTFPLSLGATWGTENKVVGLWNLVYSLQNSPCCGGYWNAPYGYLDDQTVVAYTGGIAPGQKLQLYWFPSLTVASNTLGVTYYGKYTDTNTPPLDGSAPWQLPADGAAVGLNFWTQFEGGSNPDAAGMAAWIITATPPVASFTGYPTSGIEPLSVTFTDTSTGTISNRFWDFGDSSTTNIATTVVVHTYAAGTYAVKLVVTGPVGASTNTQPNYVTALTPFQGWQIQYFGCTNCPQGQPDADPLGKGMTNTNQFLAGLNPTNVASIFGIATVAREGNDVRVTWTCVGGHSYVLQSTKAAAIDSYNTNFADASPVISVAGLGPSTTNYLDMGAAYAPVLTPPGGQNVTTSGVPSTVYSSAANTRGITDSLGNALPVGSLLMLGTFGISEPTIQSNFYAGNVSAIMSNFTLYGTTFKVGNETFLPASWDVSRSAADFGGQQIYLLAVDTPTLAKANHLGIFTAPSWTFPADGGTNTIALEDVTDFVIGAQGGSLTINLPLGGETYTFNDTARLSVLPGRILFYRVRLAQ